MSSAILAPTDRPATSPRPTCDRCRRQGHPPRALQGGLLELQPARAVPAGGPVRADLDRLDTHGRHAPHACARGEALFRAGDPFAVALRGAHRLLQDLRVVRRRPRPGHRLPDGRRTAGPGRHRHRPPHLRRDRARGLAGLRDPLRPARGAVARVHRPAAPVPQDHEPRDRARPRRDAAAGQHARRGAPGRLPAEPDAAPAGARLLGRRR